MNQCFYFDNSALLDICERHGNPEDLRSFLERSGDHVLFSEETFYELVPPDLNGKTRSVRRRTINHILSGQLPVKFMKKRNVLIKEELDFMRRLLPSGVDHIAQLPLDGVRSVALCSMATKYSKIAKGDPKRMLPQHRDQMIELSRHWLVDIGQRNAGKMGSFPFSDAILHPDSGILALLWEVGPSTSA